MNTTSTTPPGQERRDAPPQSETRASLDVTKAKWYAVADLLIKFVSALAIVVLGVAGWRLQQQDQKSRRLDDRAKQLVETREREERRYLPMLRSITEVDLVLVEISTEYAWPKADTKVEVDREARLGAHLAYLGSSLFFPDAEPSMDVVTASDNANGLADPDTVKIPARSAVLMLAWLMRLAPFFKTWDRPGVVVRLDGGELVFEDRHRKFLESIAPDQETIPAFRAWLPGTGMTLRDLFHEVDLTTLADDFHEQLGQFAEAEVRRHPEVLAQEYVRIRDEVLRSRNDLLPR